VKANIVQAEGFASLEMEVFDGLAARQISEVIF